MAATAAVILWLAFGPMLILFPLWQCPTSAGEDDLVYFYPTRAMVGRELAAGHWPAWSPYEQCGMPLAADPQAAVMYPPTWLFAALPANTAYALNIFIAFAIAGLGTYSYLRRLGVNLAAAALGAMVFQYCGFMIGHRVHLAMIATAAMLPWGLWAIECVRQRPRRALLAWPIIVYLALAAGHWPAFVNTALLWAAYLLFRGRPLGRSLAIAAGGAAVGLLVMLPQLLSSFALLSAATRQHVGFATAGENSFPPTNAVLALFPLIMGCRTPNRWVEVPWWGAWHLCETLGYVGLLTLALAGSALVRLWRRGSGGPWSPLVKLWGCLLGAAGVLMLGYYLPPVFWLVRKLPVLNIIRAPARWLEVADMALAVLAAVGVHVLTTPSAGAANDGSPAALPGAPAVARSFRRGIMLVLPAAMVGSMALMAGLTLLLQGRFPERFAEPFAGGPPQVWQSLRPDSPALWVPWAVLAVSAGGAILFLRRPARRSWVLLACLAFDLLLVARAVDMPGDPRAVDRMNPATAELVKALSADEPFRVLHLTNDYFTQPSAALAPKLSGMFGVESLAGYGPFQTPAYAHLFGLRIFGYSRDWAWLVRRNHLLSLYNVRYILCQEPYRAVLESVVIGDPNAPPPEGPNMATSAWRLERAWQDGDTLSLDRAWLFYPAVAQQEVDLAPGQVYRIELSARSPQGAGGDLWAEVSGDVGAVDFPKSPFPAAFYDESGGLLVPPEQIGRQWRHHAWTFELPANAPARLRFTVKTFSETPIEVRDVRLVATCWERPINLGGRLAAGEPVYELLASYERGGDAAGTIYVYRNRLCLPRMFGVDRAAALDDNEAVIEALRWRPEEFDLAHEVLVSQPPPPGRLVFQSETSGLPGSPRSWSPTCLPGNGIGTVRVETESSGGGP